MTKSKYAFEFLSDVILLIFALIIFSLMGCKETTPNLRIENNAQDAVHTLSQNPKTLDEGLAVKTLGPDVKVVTGQEAIVPDQKEKDIEPAKDKPGAVAVKVQY